MIAALTFGFPAISTHIAILCAPFFSEIVRSLLTVFLFNLILYLIAPVCWQMPAAWRKAYFFVWLSCTLIARILSSQIPIGIRDTPLDSTLFLLGLLVDGLFLTGNVLAIRAKEKPTSWKASGYFLLLAILPAAGVYVSVMIWSDYIARTVFNEAEKLTQGRPYCVASHKRKVENMSQLSGVNLLRARYDIGPGAGFSFLTYSRFYAVLAVQTGDREQYWNWSFKQGSFVRDANTPEIRLRVEACNPITGEKYYYSEF